MAVSALHKPVPNPFLSEPQDVQGAFDPSSLLPPVKDIPRHLVLPHDLTTVVETAFDEALKGAMAQWEEELRFKLLGTLQDVVHSQLTIVLAGYSEKIAGVEGALIAARRGIHEESVHINEKHRKVHEIINENRREAERLQEGLHKMEQEKTHFEEDKQALVSRAGKIKAAEGRVRTEEGKLNASVAQIRDERKQVLHWQHLLAQTEEGLNQREARERMSGGAPKAAPGVHQSASESLKDAQKQLDKGGPTAERYEQAKPVPGIRQAPMPLRMDGASQSPTVSGGYSQPLAGSAGVSGAFPASGSRQPSPRPVSRQPSPRPVQQGGWT